MAIQMNDYILGLLYGDGNYTLKEGREFYQFSTVHKELSERISKSLNENSIKYSHFSRSYNTEHEKGNYEDLEIIQIYDKVFISFLDEINFKSKAADERLTFSSGFIRGYLETKGTLFEYSSRGNICWRVAFSGNLEDLNSLQSFFESKNISTGTILQRKEREKIGIISKSYRLNIQNRESVSNLIQLIDGNEMSRYLKERIEAFKQFDTVTPFNMKRKVFKHYKYAVGFMARELKLDLKGIRGITIKDRQKPIFLFDGKQVSLCFRNWEQAYTWICEEYKTKIGKNPPIVETIK